MARIFVKIFFEFIIKFRYIETDIFFSNIKRTACAFLLSFFSLYLPNISIEYRHNTLTRIHVATCSKCHQIHFAHLLIRKDPIVPDSSHPPRHLVANAIGVTLFLARFEKCRGRMDENGRRWTGESVEAFVVRRAREGRQIRARSDYLPRSDQIAAEPLHRVESQNFTFVRSCMQNVSCNAIISDKTREYGGCERTGRFIRAAET